MAISGHPTFPVVFSASYQALIFRVEENKNKIHMYVRKNIYIHLGHILPRHILCIANSFSWRHHCQVFFYEVVLILLPAWQRGVVSNDLLTSASTNSNTVCTSPIRYKLHFTAGDRRTRAVFVMTANTPIHSNASCNKTYTSAQKYLNNIHQSTKVIYYVVFKTWIIL